MPPEAQSAEATEHPEVEAALPVPVLDAELRAELPTFEVFFKTFGFRRILGRVWGLLVLSDRPLSSKEIAVELAISQGAIFGIDFFSISINFNAESKNVEASWFSVIIASCSTLSLAAFEYSIISMQEAPPFSMLIYLEFLDPSLVVPMT